MPGHSAICLAPAADWIVFRASTSPRPCLACRAAADWLPVLYAAILFALLIGYALWREVMSSSALVGAALIMAGGVLGTLALERNT